MSLFRVIYASQPFGYDESTLVAILSVSRLRNAGADITGALICRRDLYLQLLEGPKAAVEATYRGIERDQRHVQIRLLSRGPITDRLFPKWAMRDDPAQSWMWTREEVASGVVDRASESEAISIFERLARDLSISDST